MILAFLLLSNIALAAPELKVAREKIHPVMLPEFPRAETDECKMLARLDEDGCNTQTYEVCTDGVTQWETGYREKTSAHCPQMRKKQNEKPVDESLWRKIEKLK